jgi:hypothetical protein
VALLLHDTAQRDGKILDEHVITICHLRGGKIFRLETLLSDVPMLNAFFVRAEDRWIHRKVVFGACTEGE